LLLFSFGGYGLALAALALVVFGAYESYPEGEVVKSEEERPSRVCSLSSALPARHSLSGS